MNTTLQTHQKNIKIRESIPLPEVIIPENYKPQIYVNLKNIKLDEVNKLLEKTGEMESTESIILSRNPSWATIVLYIIATACIVDIFIYWKKRTSRHTAATATTVGTRESPQQLQLLSIATTQKPAPSPRLTLNGGGVILPYRQFSHQNSS
ncbi:unnamed protein product [Diatraea saccharalis]|uniref:Uncharacterized protein n=1 Tax=Diatraea saccharalis TaxID=40085 RepID=A0A9N9R3Y9_9NEOP|nr:unnamed protein product [Diatraea saccharalis]